MTTKALLLLFGSAFICSGLILEVIASRHDRAKISSLEEKVFTQQIQINEQNYRLVKLERWLAEVDDGTRVQTDGAKTDITDR